MLRFVISAVALFSTTAFAQSGSYQKADGSVGKLEDLADKPLVLEFSTRTCSACNAQGAMWKSYLGSRDPENVKLLTIMLGSSAQQAEAHKEQHGYSWEYAAGSSDLYRKYCPMNLVPCNLVFMPGKGLVHRQYGSEAAQQLEFFTGKWE
jgi:hypothetical protein